ncbi:MAG: zinc ribbon domain-containing protein [Candidatus Thermoplasmatota archaeon]|nr:zinc ribbon domain-containing protein [Candidatus Thermoplasmatota archaeon]
MFCSNCGSENRPGAKFCASCGAPLSSSNSQTDSQGGQYQQQQNVSASQTQTYTAPTFPAKRHWTVTVAFIIWVLAVLSNLYSTAFEFEIHYNPGIGVGLILTLLSFFTAYNMYDADREGLYTGIIAIVIAFVWDAYLGSLISIVVVIIIAAFTFAASPHLAKGGIKKPATQ